MGDKRKMNIKLKADKFVNDKKFKLNYIKPKDLKILLAEFCEEQIADLEKTIQKLQESTFKMIDEKNEQIKQLGERCNQLLKDKGALLDQIEKMKCCTNCKHSRTVYEHCMTNKHEKWEIKEK